MLKKILSEQSLLKSLLRRATLTKKSDQTYGLLEMNTIQFNPRTITENLSILRVRLESSLSQTSKSLSEKLSIVGEVLASENSGTVIEIYLEYKDKFEFKDFGLPPVFIDLVGRETEMNKIKKYLKTTPKKKFVQVVGAPGVGKSAMMCNLATQLLSDNKYQWVIWFDVNRKLHMTLYQQVDQLSEDFPSDHSKPQVKLQNIYQALSEKNGLVVFDGVDNYRDIKDYIPEGYPIDVVVTTRDHVDWSGDGFKIRLGILDEESAKNHIITILKRFGRTCPDDAVTQIAEQCGYYPLVISQILYAIINGNKKISTILKRLVKSPLQCLSMKSFDDYASTYAAEIKTLIEVVSDDVKKSLFTIALLSSGKPIPVKLLSHIFKTSIHRNEGLITLKRKGLIWDADKAGCIRVNKILQIYVNDTFHKETILVAKLMIESIIKSNDLIGLIKPHGNAFIAVLNNSEDPVAKTLLKEVDAQKILLKKNITDQPETNYNLMKKETGGRL